MISTEERRCSFCGAVRPRAKTRALVYGAGADARATIVCADPVPVPDKPTPASCAWKFCARATDGKHRPDATGTCIDCGKPPVVAR